MGANASSSGSARESYLNLLGEDELRNVLRHLSERPHFAHWQTEVSSADVLSVLESGGPLAACARREFVVLGMKSGHNRSDKMHMDVHWADGRSRFEKLVAELAPTLQGLSIMVPLASLRNSILGDLERCRSLRCLRFRHGVDHVLLRRILEACRGNLLELSLGGDFLDVDVAEVIAENCRGLRSLRMEYDRTTSILCHVWQNVGPTLEHLSLRASMLGNEQSTNWADEIAAYCVKLTSFACNTNSICNYCPALVYLCQKLGKQLKSLEFPYLRRFPFDWELKIVLDKCPNLRFEADFSCRNVDSLTVFGDRLRVATIVDVILDDAEESGNSVPSLEDLSIIIFDMQRSESFLSSFFLTPKPALKSLNLAFHDAPLERNGNPLDVLAGLVTSLEVLSVETYWITEGVFRRMAEANKRLRKVSIVCNRCDRYTKGAEDAAVSFIEDVSQCPLLNELIVVDEMLPVKSARISDACVPFRGRAVDIVMYRNKYGRKNLFS